MTVLSPGWGRIFAFAIAACFCAGAVGCEAAPKDFDDLSGDAPEFIDIIDSKAAADSKSGADSVPDTSDAFVSDEVSADIAGHEIAIAQDVTGISSDSFDDAAGDSAQPGDSKLTDTPTSDTEIGIDGLGDATESDTILTSDAAVDTASDVSTALSEWSPPQGLLTSAKITCSASATGKAPGEFVEVATAVGVDLDTPTYWPAKGPYAGQIVRDGTGVAFADFNNDGLLDMYMPEATGKDRLYLATAPFKYKGYDAEVDGLRETGALAADFDGDGDADLVVSGYATRMLRNDGPSSSFGIKFVDVTAAVGLTGLAKLPFQAASAADVDRDGWIDLLVVANKEEGGEGGQVFPPPLYKHKIYRNKGNWKFIDESETLPLIKGHPCYLGGWFDADGDGDLDVYFVNDFGNLFGPNQYLRNDSAGPTAPLKFTDLSFDAGLDLAANGMGLAIGDVDRDGDFDLYVTGRKYGNFMMINDGNAVFLDYAGFFNVWLPGPDYVSWGALFVDFDSDGFEDLFIANGYLEPGFGDSLGGPGGMGSNEPKKQHDNYYHASGNGTFVDLAAKAGVDWDGQSRAPGWADLDNDGFADLVVGQVSGKPRVYRNGCDDRGWLHVSLKGKDGNIKGIGAIVTIKIGDIKQTRQIEAGSTGLWSTSEAAALFGLSSAQKVDELSVKWPDGTLQQFNNIPAHRRVTVVHP